MTDAYVDAVAYLHNFSVMIVGAGIGFLGCQLVQPQPGWLGPVTAIVLWLIALCLAQFGPDILLVEP